MLDAILSLITKPAAILHEVLFISLIVFLIFIARKPSRHRWKLLIIMESVITAVTLGFCVYYANTTGLPRLDDYLIFLGATIAYGILLVATLLSKTWTE